MPVPTTETEVTTTETATKAPKAKKAAKAKPPKGGKKGPPTTKTAGQSKWYAPILKYLKKHPNGETKAKVKQDLSTGSLGGVLENYPNLIVSKQVEGVRGLTYVLTAAGRKAAESV